MSPVDQARAALAFEAPDRQAKGDYAVAEKECFKAMGRLVQRLRDLAREKQEAEQRSQRLWEEKEALGQKLNKYLVRNLIPLVDNCKSALGDRPGARAALQEASLAVDGVEPAPVAGETPVDGSEPMQSRYLESMLRSVLSLLTSLDLYRIELLGRSAEDVIVGGEAIDNPFEIEEAEAKGKLSELRVREVIEDLWVSKKNGVLEVVRKGKVKC
jgi:hypothetical protein